MMAWGISHASYPEKEKPRISQEAFQSIRPGDEIAYLLPASARPTNPWREWHGCVERILVERVLVRVLDEGYQGEYECVRATEIVSVTPSAHQ